MARDMVECTFLDHDERRWESRILQVETGTENLKSDFQRSLLKTHDQRILTGKALFREQFLEC
jgi:hypothetical protein